jgi:Domain of unknown function (DUF4189)
MNRFVLTAAASVGLSVGLAAPAPAAGTWAAIASSPSKHNYSAFWGPGTKNQAEQKAVQRCNADSKVTDCLVVASSADCVAVARELSGSHFGVGPNAQAAEANAQSRSAGGATDLQSWCSTDPGYL